MAITVEDGTGIAEAESYLSVADFKTYADNRGLSYAGRADTEIEQALRRGTTYLDARYANRWPGTRANGRAQGLMWPRIDATDAEWTEIEADEIPKEVLNALAEATVRELTSPGSLSPDVTNSAGGAVIREKVGPLEVEYSEGSTGRLRPLIQVLDDILAPLFGTKGNTVWLARG